MTHSTSVYVPRIFFSYAWTDENFSQRVLGLAERLCSNGVHVIIDRWDLQVGADAHHFMESMVTDSTIDKVVIICNASYVQKANDRRSGVGIETQVITQDLYKKREVSKYGLVAFEVDENGDPYSPAFYGSRIYVNLADEQGYEDEYERLLRWIHERPLYRRPPIGPRPQHLDADGGGAPTSRSSFLRAKTAIQRCVPQAGGMIRQFRDDLKVELDAHRISVDGKEGFDDKVIESINSLKELATELQQLARDISIYSHSDEIFSELIDCLETVRDHTQRPDHITQWKPCDFDNFRFFAHEAMVGTAAVLVKERRFDLFASLLSRRFLGNRDTPQRPTVDFREFYQPVRSLEIRNERLKLRRYSLHADLLSERYTGKNISMADLMQADVMLFLRSCVIAAADSDAFVRWWPITLIYAHDRYFPFDLFARGESRKFLQPVLDVIGVRNSAELKRIIELARAQRWIPEWGFMGFDIGMLTNIDRLGLFE